MRLAAAAAGAALGVGLAVLLPTSELWARVVITMLPGSIGTVIWLMSGSGVVAALSWALPVTGILALAEFVIPRPLDILALVAGLTWYVAMLVWVPLVDWWYERVLHRDPALGPFDDRPA